MPVKKEAAPKVLLPITCKYMENRSLRCGGRLKLLISGTVPESDPQVL